MKKQIEQILNLKKEKGKHDQLCEKQFWIHWLKL